VRDFPKSAGYLALLTARGTASRFSQMHELLNGLLNGFYMKSASFVKYNKNLIKSADIALFRPRAFKSRGKSA
jgi:hypothetical protein